jgi:hypothetical protein
MGHLYRCEYTSEEKKVLEQLRLAISSTGMGATLQGNRLTTRFYVDGELCDVHMVIDNVDTPEERRKNRQAWYDQCLNSRNYGI